MAIVKKLDSLGNLEGYWEEDEGVWVTEEDYLAQNEEESEEEDGDE